MEQENQNNNSEKDKNLNTITVGDIEVTSDSASLAEIEATVNRLIAKHDFPENRVKKISRNQGMIG